MYIFKTKLCYETSWSLLLGNQKTLAVKKGHESGVRGASNILFLNLRAGYVGVFILWYFTKLYTYDLCSFYIYMFI